MMKSTLKILCDHGKLNLEECDATLSEFRKMITNEKTKCRDFDNDEDRLDIFYWELLRDKKDYKKIWKIVSRLLVLSHGQASVERGFSINKHLERCNMSEETFIAQRVIKDHISRAGGVLNVPISPKMLISVSSARARYDANLEDQRHERKSKEHNMKRKTLMEELEVFKTKKRRLQTDRDALEKRADELAEEAEVTRKLTLITQSNSLRKTARNKCLEIDNINKEIDSKLKELKNN